MFKDDASIEINHNQPEVDKQRVQIVQEIVNSEREYLKSLVFVVQKYMQPILKQRILDKEDSNRLFKDFRQILEFQSRFFAGMCHEFNKKYEDQAYGALFVLFSEQFKCYSMYCANHPTVLAMTMKLNNLPVWVGIQRSILRMTNSLGKGGGTAETTNGNIIGSGKIKTMSALLLEPIQRICKYPLLLSRLSETTPATHFDYENIKLALLKMTEVTLYINYMRVRMDGYSQLLAVQQQCDMTNWAGPTLLGSGDLVAIGKLSVVLANKNKSFLSKEYIKRKMHIVLTDKRTFVLKSQHKKPQHNQTTIENNSSRIGNNYVLKFSYKNDELMLVSGTNNQDPSMIQLIDQLSPDKANLFIQIKNKPLKKQWVDYFSKVIFVQSQKSIIEVNQDHVTTLKFSHQIVPVPIPLSRSPTSQLIELMSCQYDTNNSILFKPLSMELVAELIDVDECSNYIFNENITHDVYNDDMKNRHMSDSLIPSESINNLTHLKHGGSKNRDMADIKKEEIESESDDNDCMGVELVNKYDNIAISDKLSLGDLPSVGGNLLASRKTSNISLSSINISNNNNNYNYDDDAVVDEDYSQNVSDYSINQTMDDLQAISCKLRAEHECWKCGLAIRFNGRGSEAGLEAMGRSWHKGCFSCTICDCTLEDTFITFQRKPYCQSDYLSLFKCHQCDLSIGTNRILALKNTMYHYDCVKCTVCEIILGDSEIFVVDNKFYCGAHSKKKGPICHTCKKTIVGSITKALDKTYHPSCFKCTVEQCTTVFIDSKYYKYDNLPFCHPHYLEKLNMICSYCTKPLQGLFVPTATKKYHTSCLYCQSCKRRIHDTEPVQLNEDQLYCQDCSNSFDSDCTE